MFGKDDKRAAPIEEAIKRLEEEGYYQEALATDPNPFASQFSFLGAFTGVAEEAASSSSDPPSAEKKSAMTPDRKT